MEHYVLTIGITQANLPHIQEELDGTEVTLYAAADVRDAVIQLSRRPFSLVVADLHAASWDDCTTLMAALRRVGHIPILAITNYQDENRSASILELGVDVCQPWDIPPRLLAKQVRNVLRRFTDYGRYDKPDADIPLHQGDISIDPQKRVAYVRGEPVQLRPREFSLLKCFMRYPNIVLTADIICNRAWGGEYVGDVGRAVYDLWQRLEPDPANPAYILTEHRVGYRFTPYCSETCDE